MLHEGNLYPRSCHLFSSKTLKCRWFCLRMPTISSSLRSIFTSVCQSASVFLVDDGRSACDAGDGRKVLLDVDWKKPDQILSELTAIVGKTE